MRLTTHNTAYQVDLKRILSHGLLEAHFQQVVSMTRQTVCGMEGLIRSSETPVPPRALFDAAQAEGLTVELDRLCRDTVLAAFSRVHALYPDKMLFVNVDASILDETAGSGYLLRQAEKYHIPPDRIVVEINEACMNNAMALKNFTSSNRRSGFLLALDDVGVGFSNLNRIPLVRPDIIKIDMSLVRRIQFDYHRQEVFRSLVRLASHIGAVAVAEGVETEEEALAVLQLGAGMIQGYYFSRPQKLDGDPFSNGCIEGLAEKFKERLSWRVAKERSRYADAAQIVRQALHRLKRYGDFDEALQHIITGSNAAECAYVLDSRGIQISDTVFRPGSSDRRNGLFNSAHRGADHSMEPYYYGLHGEKTGQFMTDPYVSLATGNLCVTFSGAFSHADGRYILCMDFPAGWSL